MRQIKTVNLLPEFLRSDPNKKFLGATLDQLISEPNFKKINGYVGRTFAPTYKTGDNYLIEPTKERQQYQLEPCTVVTDDNNKVTFFSSYDDLLKKIEYYGGNISDHSRLFSNTAYSFDGLIDFDKLVNFNQYYWLPSGPDAVDVFSGSVDQNDIFTITHNNELSAYQFSERNNIQNPEITLARGGTYQFVVNQNSQFWIQTDPGIEGHKRGYPNINIRDVFGVKDNGLSNGTIIFNVPQADAQSYYRQMPIVHPGGATNNVDFVATGRFTDINHHLLSHVIANNYFDGINAGIGGKYVVFVDNDVTDDSWEEQGVYAFRPYDSDLPDGSYAQGDFIPIDKRTSIWQIYLEDTGTGDPLVHLRWYADIPVEHRVSIKAGELYGGLEFFKNKENRMERVPFLTAHLDTLFYNDGEDQHYYGKIRIVDMTRFLINVDEEIIGKSEYKSPNGVTLTNGMKIRFDTMVTPSEYSEGIYFVDGVGTAIKLVKAEHLVTPEFEQNSTFVPFDTIGYSIDKFDQIIGGPKDPDYITIKRSSKDANPWSRSNRWFHEDVVMQTARYNNVVPNLDFAMRAKRPIIEFDPDLQLINHGKSAVHNVDILDLTTDNALVEVEGDIGAYYENLTLKNGTTVIFANDFDPIVKNKIFTVQIIDINGQLKVHLVPHETLIKENDTVIPLQATVVPLIPLRTTENSAFTYNPSYRRIEQTIELLPETILTGVIGTNTGIVEGSNFWFDGIKWKEGQKKTKINQPPLFDVHDQTGISFSDQNKYLNSSFKGSKIFSYKLGYGTNDTTMGFPLSYRNFNNIGDIEFENSFDVDKFTFLNGIKTERVKINTGVIPIVTGQYKNIWTTVSEKTKQFQIFTNTYDGTTTYFEIDILPEQNVKIPNLKVYVNNKLLNKKLYKIEKVKNRVAVNIPTGLKLKDHIDILIYSKAVSTMGYYEIPSSLNMNSMNTSFSSLTLGQFRNHLQTIANNSTQVIGQVPGYSNFRDLNIKGNGGNILQHAGPAVYSSLFLIDEKVNFISSITLAQNEYTRFKNRFLESFTSVVDAGLMHDVPAGVDYILAKLNVVKNQKSPWYYSDMVPYDANRTILDYSVLNAEIVEYEIDDIFDDTTLSNRAILVYLNGVQLLKDHDYYFSKSRPSIVFTKPLLYGQQIQIITFHNTDGCFIPETPTKLGLYPKFKPEMYIDYTYQRPISVIRGHDGSITPVFGDVRDKLLLELESRIYNNIKVQYNQKQFDINQYIPGRFRKTEYTRLEFSDILARSFLNWIGSNKVDFSSNTWFTHNNAWTWTYNKFHDVVSTEPLPGWWRGIYNFFFGTDSPNTRPWEMLGFSEMPDWWIETYGVAPYTGGNLVLWGDLEKGLIRNGPRKGIDTIYARPGLTKVIPVSVSGELISPHSFAVTDFNSLFASGSFAIGDEGPAETAWRRSSDFPFAVQQALALMKPGMYFGQLANVNSYVYNELTNQMAVESTNQRITKTDIKINGKNERTAGYINWIADYLINMNLDPTTTIRSYVDKLNIQLGYKVAGFTDKPYLKVLAEQSSPSSINESIIIPDENYKVHLHKSSPINRIVYSAVIIERTNNGYSVSGYNNRHPFFTIIPSNVSGPSRLSEVVDSHAAIYEEYERIKVTVPYGYNFNTKQQVVDFLISYGRFLQSQGFIFEDFSQELGAEQNWELSVKEFMTWSQQGWTAGSIIVLSPLHNLLKTFNFNVVVDEINNFPDSSKILDIDFNVVDKSKFNIVREKSRFTLETTSDVTIGLADLSLVQFEHVLIFDNETVFKDVIYKPELGNRQYRLKLIGNKTGEWDGRVSPSGFIYVNSDIKTWNSGTDYKKGELVRYKGYIYTALTNILAADTFDYGIWKQIDQSKIKSGLLPNLAYNAKKFEYMYDIENQISDQNVNKFANGLIGYRDRNYLEDLGVDTIAQTKFYQGFIKDKGTKGAITALTNAKFNNLNSEVVFKEEWAFRVGEYGAIESDQFFEVQLADDLFISNPIAFTLLETGQTTGSDQVVGIYKETLYKKPLSFKTNVFNNRSEHSNYQNDIMIAGYVNTRDVDATLVNLTDISTLNSLVTSIGNGFKIWVAKDLTNNWNVYRVDETTISITKLTYVTTNFASLTFNKAHMLNVNDCILIKSFGVTFNGFYQVSAVVDDTTITVQITPQSNLVIGTGYTGFGKLFILQSVRYNYFSDAVESPERDWKLTDNIWVDNANEKNEWAVYKKVVPWNYTSVLRNPDFASSGNMGFSLAISKDSRFVLASSPKLRKGEVTSYINTSVGFVDAQLLDSTIISHIETHSVEPTVQWAPTLTASINRLTNTINIELSNLPVSISPRIVKWVGTTSDILDFANDNSKELNIIPAGVNSFSRSDIPVSKFAETVILYLYVGSSFAGTLLILANQATDFGASVVMSNKTAVISAKDAESTLYASLGKVLQIYKINQVGLLSQSQLLYDYQSNFGKSMALSEDEQWLYVVSSDKIYVYTKRLPIDHDNTTFDNYSTSFDTGTWYVKVNTINAPLTLTEFGKSIATNDDGSLLVVGAPSAPVNGKITGIAYLYTRYNSKFTLAQTFKPEQLSYNARFGESVCFSNNYTELLIGAPGYVDYNYHSGVVYRYLCQTLVYNTILCTELESAVDVQNGAAMIINGVKISFNGSEMIPGNLAPIIGSATNQHSILGAKIVGLTATIEDQKLRITYNAPSSSRRLTIHPYIDSTNPLDVFTELGLEVFTQVQMIKHPYTTSMEGNFGTTIAASNNGTVFITSNKAPTLTSMKIDTGDMTFDNKSTYFSDRIGGTGAVYVYNVLTNTSNSINDATKLGFTQSLTGAAVNSGDDFGYAVAATNQMVMVGAPNSDLRFFSKLVNDLPVYATNFDNRIYVTNIKSFTTTGIINIGSERIEYGFKVVESEINDSGYLSGIVRLNPIWHFAGELIAILDSGKVFAFNNPTGKAGWELIRKQQPTVDLDNITRLYLYDKKTQNTLTTLDYIDPAKGKILGIAEQEITYKTSQDPASYNFGSSSIVSVDAEYHWGESQVGLVWWDLSTVRFVDYEQDDLDYRIQSWGKIFPNSSIDVYEWVKSDQLPSNYGNGISKYRNNEAYVRDLVVDKGTGVITAVYYYWVKNKSSFDATLPNRKLPVTTITDIIANPAAQGIPFAAIIRNDSIALANCNNLISADNTIVHVDYSIVKNNNLIHNEYELVQEDSEHTFLPNKIVSKLIDSITGADKSGNMVPDYTLNESERYGISIRPRQSMVVKRLEAARNLVEFVNSVFAVTPIAAGFNLDKLFDFEQPPLTWDSFNINLIVETLDELSYIDITTLRGGQRILVRADKTFDNQWAIYEYQINNTFRVVKSQSYRTTDYWEYIDWFASTYDPTVKPSFTVDLAKDIAKLRIVPGQTVKVRNNGNYLIYEITAKLGLKLVGIHNGTIRLKDSLWAHETNQIGFSNDNFDTVRFDLNPTIEFRNIIEALRDHIFVDTLDKEFSKMFFMLLNYILSEQRMVDWAFKTSFVSIVHKLRKLEQFPNYIKDNQSYYEDYINEVKPYRTKIREYTIDYEGLDQSYTKVSDFDLPSYYDSDYGVWRSPNNEHARDPLLWVLSPNYADWTTNHTLKIMSVDIVSRGYGYTAPPRLTVVGGGGIDAQLEAVIDYYTGSIFKIIVKNPGYGYTSTPTILVEGDGVEQVTLPTGTKQTVQSLRCSPVMGNEKVRSLKMNIKFDRIAYSYTILKWTPNEEYFKGELVSHNGATYLIPEDMFADKFFDPLRYTLIDSSLINTASDRVNAFYAPTIGMQPSDIKQLFYGTEYTGVNVDGYEFDESKRIFVDSNIDNGTFTDVYTELPSDVEVVGGDFIDHYESHSPEELMPGIMFDTLDIQVYTIDPSAVTDEEKMSNPIGFRISKTMDRENSVVTLLLDQQFTKDDSTIYVDNVSLLVTHNGVNPGFIYIGGEKIAYTNVDVVNNSISGLTRHVGEYKYETQQYYLGLIYRVGTFISVLYVDDVVNSKPWEFRRIAANAMTELAEDLAYDATLIKLVDVSGFPTPSKRHGNPGVIYINGEKIHYYTIDYVNNMLGQLRRGVWGTGTPLVHVAGTVVTDASVEQRIPGDNMHQMMLNQGIGSVTDTTGIFGSNTYAGLFLKSEKTKLPLLPGEYNNIEDPNANKTRFDDDGTGEMFTPLHPFDADPFDSFDPG